MVTYRLRVPSGFLEAMPSSSGLADSPQLVRCPTAHGRTVSFSEADACSASYLELSALGLSEGGSVIPLFSGTGRAAGLTPSVGAWRAGSPHCPAVASGRVPAALVPGGRRPGRAAINIRWSPAVSRTRAGSR